MANERISEMPVAPLPLSGSELVEIVLGGPGSNRQTTTQDIANLGGGGITSVNGDTGPAVVLDATDVGADPTGSAATAESNANTYTDAGVAFSQEYSEGLITNVPAKKTMSVARTTALPSYVATPGSGSTRTILTASVNGAFPTTDGIAVGSILSVGVFGETAGNAKYNGPYELIDAGSAGTKWILQRTKDTQSALATFPVELADVRILFGTVNAGRTFRQTTPNVTVDTTAQTWVDTRTLTLESLGYALSDDGASPTPITVGVKLTDRMPYAFHVSAVRISLTTAQTASSFVTVDVKKNGVSILSTLVSIDNNEKTSVTAVYPVVISTPDFADDDEVQFSVTQVGIGTVAAGLKARLIGYRI